MRSAWLPVAPALALALAVVWPAGGAAGAEPVDISDEDGTLATARYLYEAGDFAMAAEMASGLETAPGLTLAARAMLAFAATRAAAADSDAAFRRAEALARAAIARDDAYAEAYRLRVVALGHIARAGSPMAAFLDGYPNRARALIDRALALEPESPWVHVVLGAWHAEIVAAAGPGLAEVLYGASAGAARAAFERAIAIDPRNPVLHFEYASALVRLNGLALDGRAETELAAAAGAEPLDAFEAVIVAKADRARRAIGRGDVSTAVRLLVPDAGRAAAPGN